MPSRADSIAGEKIQDSARARAERWSTAGREGGEGGPGASSPAPADALSLVAQSVDYIARPMLPSSSSSSFCASRLQHQHQNQERYNLPFHLPSPPSTRLLFFPPRSPLPITSYQERGTPFQCLTGRLRSDHSHQNTFKCPGGLVGYNICLTSKHVVVEGRGFDQVGWMVRSVEIVECGDGS